MSFCFLETNGQDNAIAGDFTNGWYLVLFDEEDGLGSFGNASADSLGKMTEFVGELLFPDAGFVGTFDEVSILLDLARDWISD
jgi:hypothetical protein